MSNTPADVTDEDLGLIGRRIGLTVRARKAARRAGATTLRELARFAAIELLELKNCGASTIRNIRDVLRQHGLVLREDDTP